MKITIAAAIGLLALSVTEAVKVNPLPAPVTIQWAKTGPVKVDNNFKIVGPNHDILNKAYSRTASLIKSERWSPATWERPAGEFPAFPTLSKRGDEEEFDAAPENSRSSKKTLKTVQYTHRGVLYDTSRNFYNLKSLYRQIDALSYAKMNVFHWHITDNQSWPVEIKKYPQMTKDAYSPREVYTQKDIAAIIKYGRERGVRVIPELDMPGHSSSGWLQVDKKAVTCADS
ncbi:hypothetical protein BGZ96_006099, partial [Linnemannia gamsii]